MDVRLKIYRFHPEVDQSPYYREYTVSAQPGDRILDCLNRIRWEQDGTLAFRMSCGHGVCGSDAIKINGRCTLACQKLVKDYEGKEVVLEPLPTYRVIKDLIVDLEPFFEKIRFINPFLISDSEPGGTERVQSPEDRKKMGVAIRCILCACCTAACPVSNVNDHFLGPAPLVWAFRFIFDSRDDRHLQRLEQVNYPDGARACVNHFECTRVCPREIPVTKYINFIKREIENALTPEAK